MINRYLPLYIYFTCFVAFQFQSSLTDKLFLCFKYIAADRTTIPFIGGCNEADMIKISLGDENKCFLDLNKLDRKLLIITPSSDSAFYEVEKLIYMPRNKNSIEVEF